MDESNHNLDEALQKIIQEQIRKYDPPETKQTYHRLIKEGLPKDAVMAHIVYVLSEELYNACGDDPFNQERYINNLKALPIKPEQLKK